jgi:hypothetical protein
MTPSDFTAWLIWEREMTTTFETDHQHADRMAAIWGPQAHKEGDKLILTFKDRREAGRFHGMISYLIDYYRRQADAVGHTIPTDNDPGYAARADWLEGMQERMIRAEGK